MTPTDKVAINDTVYVIDYLVDDAPYIGLTGTVKAIVMDLSNTIKLLLVQVNNLPLDLNYMQQFPNPTYFTPGELRLVHRVTNPIKVELGYN